MKNLVIAVGAALTLSAGVLQASDLNAAGATFPAPIYQKWFQDYKARNSSVQINYQSIGSGGGIRQLTAGTVDFGASDAPMSDDQMSKITRFKVLHFPTVLGAVVPAYNISGVSQDLKFSGETLAGIFMGTITKWNDGRIAKDNPGVKLPASDITVIHRSDGSGTTFVFTDYLSKVSPEWKSKLGANTAVNWPVGLGGKGNEGVSGLVKQTPNSIGYVELVYAAQNNMAFGAVKNAAGVYVKASTAGVTAAAAGAARTMPADFRVSIVDAPGKGAYPISSFTWLLIPTHFDDASKRDDVKNFLKWMLADGQKNVEALHYAPLPKQVVAKEMSQINLIR
ncbi:MAG TPA: phosphate ABC transporter substrate-binding protein PstS [Bryobacteraceae bacterium]|nr:phosphate ABC transporter substrate-binding protein PstS [Bryobacteraceae bacterium]